MFKSNIYDACCRVLLHFQATFRISNLEKCVFATRFTFFRYSLHFQMGKEESSVWLEIVKHCGIGFFLWPLQAIVYTMGNQCSMTWNEFDGCMKRSFLLPYALNCFYDSRYFSIFLNGILCKSKVNRLIKPGNVAFCMRSQMLIQASKMWFYENVPSTIYLIKKSQLYFYLIIWLNLFEQEN